MTADRQAKFLPLLVINVESSVIMLNSFALSPVIAGFSLLAHFMLKQLVAATNRSPRCLSRGCVYNSRYFSI